MAIGGESITVESRRGGKASYVTVLDQDGDMLEVEVIRDDHGRGFHIDFRTGDDTWVMLWEDQARGLMEAIRDALSDTMTS